MSKYKGQHGEKKGQKFGQGPPPPLFGQCPKEIDFSMGGVPLIATMENVKEINFSHFVQSLSPLKSYLSAF